MAARRRPPANLLKTTIRDFGGGWNTIDLEQNVRSRYSPVFENVFSYADNSVSPRFGTKLYVRLKTGTTGSGTLPVGATLDLTLGSPVGVITWAKHPFYDAVHSEAINGHFQAELGALIDPSPDAEVAYANRIRSVKGETANTFSVYFDQNALADATIAIEGAAYSWDYHAIGGNIVDGFCFDEHIIIVSECGDIVRISSDRTVERIWDYLTASSLSGSPPPWRYTQLVAKDFWNGNAILSNGLDKPLLLNFSGISGTHTCDYMVDPGNLSSNAEIPAFDACKSAFQFFTIHDTETTDEDVRATVRISAKKTSVVFSGAPSPSDSVDINVSQIMSNPDVEIVGFATIKGLLMVVMPTASTFLKLNNYVEVGTDRLHDPSPEDTMPGYGTVARRSIIELGNDVFMLDRNGVPSASLSAIQNTIVPQRVSHLIEPQMTKHLARLSAETLRLKAFGFYDPANKGVHFYLPKYDEADIRSLGYNPLYYGSLNNGTNYIMLRVVNHEFEEGDVVTIAGATAFGDLTTDQLNTTHNIISILSDNVVLIDYEGDPIATTYSISGGGVNATVQPINDETVGYWYHYVPNLKVNSWSRYKRPSIVAGFSSPKSQVFVCTTDSVYEHGAVTSPVYGDFVDEYDVTWENDLSIAVGTLVRDPDTYEVFRALEATTAPSSGTFGAHRDADYTIWEEYKGEPIEMVWELPWADFGARQDLKMLQHIHIDAKGTARFKVEAFVDEIYRSGEFGELTPVRSIEFVAGDSGGYGTGDQPYGGGRRTREQFIWPLPIRFKLLKLRITASTTEALRINAISFLYQKGAVKRT